MARGMTTRTPAVAVWVVLACVAMSVCAEDVSEGAAGADGELWAKEANIRPLNAANMDMFLQANDFVLVHYYDENNELHDEFHKCAVLLEEFVAFGSVDAALHHELVRDRGVQEIPGVVVYGLGDAYTYDGAHEAKDIVYFALEVLDDFMHADEDGYTRRVAPDLEQRVDAAVDNQSASLELTSELEVASLLAADEVIFMGFFEDTSEYAYQAWREVAQAQWHQYTFAEVTAPALLAAMDVQQTPSVLCFRVDANGEQGAVALPGDINVVSLTDWVRELGFVPVVEITLSNFQRRVLGQKPTVIYFHTAPSPDDEAFGSHLELLEELAYDFREDFSFNHLNATEYDEFCSRMGVTTTPSIFILNAIEQQRYAFEGEIAGDALRDFMRAFMEEKLHPVLRSEEEPEENQGPVRIIVGNSYQREVHESERFTFVLFHAPHCPHCVKAGHAFAHAALRWVSPENVQFAKINVADNDVDKSLGITEIPTLILFAPDGSATPFEALVTVEDLSAFVVTHTGVEPTEEDEASFQAAEEVREEEEETADESVDDGSEEEESADGGEEDDEKEEESTEGGEEKDDAESTEGGDESSTESEESDDKELVHADSAKDIKGGDDDDDDETVSGDKKKKNKKKKKQEESGSDSDDSEDSDDEGDRSAPYGGHDEL